jgi:hypothetical protein
MRGTFWKKSLSNSPQKLSKLRFCIAVIATQTQQIGLRSNSLDATAKRFVDGGES